MAEEWILENAHLRMCVSSLGGKVQSLFSRQYQAPVLYENPAGGMFLDAAIGQSRRRQPFYFFMGRRLSCLATMPTSISFFTVTAGYSAGILLSAAPSIVYYSCVGSMPAVSIIWRSSATSCCVTS